MTPDEIMEAYNVIASSTNDYVEQEAAKIGNSQRSLGTLAERVASPSGQTAGLANYTYDRTLRPVVDTLTTELVTKGKAQALQNTLDTALRNAKNAYESARNAAASSPSSVTPPVGGNKPYTETTDAAYTGEKLPYISAGTITGVGLISDAARLDGKKRWSIGIADGKGGVREVFAWGRTSEEALQDYYRSIGSGASGYGQSSGGGGGGSGGGWGATSTTSPLDTWESLDLRNIRR